MLQTLWDESETLERMNDINFPLRKAESGGTLGLLYPPPATAAGPASALVLDASYQDCLWHLPPDKLKLSSSMSPGSPCQQMAVLSPQGLV